MTEPITTQKACPSLKYGVRVLSRQMINSLMGVKTDEPTEKLETAVEPVAEIATEPEVVAEPVPKEETAQIEAIEEETVEEPIVTTPISELDISIKLQQQLLFNAIETIEQLNDLVSSGKSLVDLPKIGSKGSVTILEALQAWQSKNSTTISSPMAEKNESEDLSVTE